MQQLRSKVITPQIFTAFIRSHLIPILDENLLVKPLCKEKKQSLFDETANQVADLR